MHVTILQDKINFTFKITFKKHPYQTVVITSFKSIYQYFWKK